MSDVADLYRPTEEHQAFRAAVREVCAAKVAPHAAETDELARRLPDERAYRLLEDADAVTFGNGVNGSIPAADSQVFHDSYRVTLGSAGNLTAGLGWRIAGIPQGAAAGVGTNPAPLTGGRDRSSVDELVRAARP